MVFESIYISRVQWKKRKFFYSANVVKAKWMRLRETYMKKRREAKLLKRSGAAAQCSVAWKWAKQMEFIEPFVQPRR